MFFVSVSRLSAPRLAEMLRDTSQAGSYATVTTPLMTLWP